MLETPRNESNKDQDRVRDLFKNSNMPQDFVTTQTSFRRGSSGGGSSYELIIWSWIAGITDFLLITSLVCFSLVGVAFFAQASIDVVTSQFIFISVASSYYILLRSFLGSTAGEWVCGLRLGSLQERFNKSYTAKVCFRTLLIFATGIITLPIVSMLVGKDIAGKISGLQLVKLHPTR